MLPPDPGWNWGWIVSYTGTHAAVRKEEYKEEAEEETLFPLVPHMQKQQCCKQERGTRARKLHQAKMKARWLFSLFCLLSVPSVTEPVYRGLFVYGSMEMIDYFSHCNNPLHKFFISLSLSTADVITQTEVVHAPPGIDITLVCVFPKLHSTHIIKTQWSKTDGSPSTKIAVYHPTYGTHYFKFSEAPYNFSVSFSTRIHCSGDDTGSSCSTNPNAMSECNWWVLHLENTTMSLTGQYECTFATYPYGTKAAKIQLTVKAEEKRHYLKKVWLKQTLEIPCLEDETSENLSTYPLKWLVDENGWKEELVTKEPSCPSVYRKSSMLYGQKVLLGLNNTLKVFLTKITDDGRVFSCHVLYHPRVQKSSTIVRVFAYPEISISLEESSASATQKPNVSWKALPKSSLLQYMDRANLTEQPGVQEDLQDSEDFYELRSTLMFQGTHKTHKTFSCNKSSEASAEVFTTTVSDEHQSTSVASLDFTSPANFTPASTTQAGVLTSTTEAKGYTRATAFSEALTTAHDITDQTISVTRGKDFFPTSSLLNNELHVSLTGDRRNAKASGFPWPTVVAVLLLLCSTLVALGISKWCQYQKEIMNRPPSFKPPPPPIKYTSMVESDGTPPSCHELESL
ncbi:LOW QUALITY PROTEIN: T-cell surface protein tactile [Ammospiza maritima maritima]